MKTHKPDQSATGPILLGVEGGATQTVILVSRSDTNAAPSRFLLGPSNFRLMTAEAIQKHLNQIHAICPNPGAIGIGMAGVRTSADVAKLRSLISLVWPGVPSWAGSDLDTAFAADELKPDETARVLVLSGTGSCCVVETSSGIRQKSGGWGHVLGDRGSGYEIGREALRAVVREFDQTSKWPLLGSRILRSLLLNEPEQLIDWARDASKESIAALAREVFAAFENRDRLATSVIQMAAKSLADDACACARLAVKRKERLAILFAGSVTLRQPRFQRMILQQVRSEFPGARARPLEVEGANGALRLALRNFPELQPAAKREIQAPEGAQPPAIALPLTEQRNPRSMNFDRLSTVDAVKLMFEEESKVTRELLQHSSKIARTIHWVTNAIRRGGRLIYVGAGTSGRLGILDASECPPTFRSPPEWVQGIIAGGQSAVWQAVEGAEDDAGAGGRAIEFRRISEKDVVIGIAASGRTPFVIGALKAAKSAGARTVFITFNPAVKFQPGEKPSLLIAVPTGPEILTGSTRLKAGTATKLILNAITTVSMVRLGKVVQNLMIDLNPSNAKLKQRAVRILSTLSGKLPEDCESLLIECGWNIKLALKSARRNRSGN